MTRRLQRLCRRALAICLAPVIAFFEAEMVTQMAVFVILMLLVALAVRVLG